MYSRDFAKEIGLKTEVKTVPLKTVIPLFATLAAGIWFGLVQTGDDTRSAQTPAKLSLPAASQGDAVATR